MSALRVLAVATKVPHPPVGGGNVALDGLLNALAAADVEVRAVAPGRRADPAEPAAYPIRTVAAAPRPWLLLAGHLAVGMPVGVARYHLRALAAAVEAELATFDPHVVHVEQAQLYWLVRLIRSRRPVLLREQNVESHILERLAEIRGGAVAAFLRREARRTAAVEARACRAADTVAAISEPDAARLRSLAPAARICVLPSPLPRLTHFAAAALSGEPPFVCLGSFDWAPSRDGAFWLLREVWPTLRELLPGAMLHLAGPGSLGLRTGGDARVRRHGVVPSAGALYDPRAVALVPVRAGSGVRVRILEAWGAGVPVVTTAVGGEGLVGADGAGALIADAPLAFAAAAAKAATDPDLRGELVRAGRTRIEGHRAEHVAGLAVQMYRETISRHVRRAAVLDASVSGHG